MANENPEKSMTALNLYHCCYWAEVNPNELLALKDDVSSTKAEKMLDTFVADKDTSLTESEKYNVVIAVKSFFKHNYKDLARASGCIQYTPSSNISRAKRIYENYIVNAITPVTVRCLR